MKILITGASGMVGRNLLESFQSSSHTILSPSSSELNLLEKEATKSYLKESLPDFIIHSAGRVGGIQANMKDPLGFLYENFEMGKNLAMASMDLGVSNFLNFGSSCMYPRGHDGLLDEGLLFKGELEPTNEGYAIAKVAVAKLCEYIGQTSEKLNYKTLIPCNLFGRFDKFGESNSHMIPAVIVKIHQAKKTGLGDVEIWGDGKARREFMYTGEFAKIIVDMIDKISELPDYMNIGLGEDYSIDEYYHAIARVVGYEGQFTHNLDRPVGMNRKIVDVKKMKEIGFQSSLTLEEGIQKTYEYYLNEVAKK